MHKVFPPLNFAAVEDNLYRSAFPNELNFSFLQSLNLKTVICLETSSLSEPFAKFMEEQQIQYVTFDDIQSPEGGLHESIIKDSLQILFDKSRYPILITCKLGKYLTGVLVGCLRKYQRWAFISIFEEYRRFAGSRMQQQHEQFIELFDTDLVTPEEQTVPEFLEDAVERA